MRILPGFIAVLMLVVPNVTTAQASVPSDRQAAILARALAYDRELKTRAGATVDIAVVAPATDVSAQQRAHQQAAGFVALGDLKIAGLPLRVHELPLTTVDALAATMKQKGVDAVFVVGLNTDQLKALLAECARLKAVSMGGSRALVDIGVALGVEAVGDKPTIFVNIPAADSEGASFAANLLRVAVVVKAGAP
ncbi:MAG TPA: YfiR/HmsC family protein [Myxococcota bacterium]